jgi:hypothetical protein
MVLDTFRAPNLDLASKLTTLLHPDEPEFRRDPAILAD